MRTVREKKERNKTTCKTHAHTQADMCGNKMKEKLETETRKEWSIKEENQINRTSPETGCSELREAAAAGQWCRGYRAKYCADWVRDSQKEKEEGECASRLHRSLKSLL